MAAKKNQELELRLTFETWITNVSSVLTVIEAKAFCLGLSLRKEKMGGFIEQTWGVAIKGPESEIGEFGKWFEQTIPDLCQSSAAAAAVKYFEVEK